jgi:colicin import membrane protein
MKPEKLKSLLATIRGTDAAAATAAEAELAAETAKDDAAAEAARVDGFERGKKAAIGEITQKHGALEDIEKKLGEHSTLSREKLTAEERTKAELKEARDAAASAATEREAAKLEAKRTRALATSGVSTDGWDMVQDLYDVASKREGFDEAKWMADTKAKLPTLFAGPQGAAAAGASAGAAGTTGAAGATGAGGGNLVDWAKASKADYNAERQRRGEQPI